MYSLHINGLTILFVLVSLAVAYLVGQEWNDWEANKR